MKLSARMLAIGALTITLPSFAEAPPPAPETSTVEVERCVSQHENARLLRLKEQWLDAREAMTRCAEEACPLALRTDCSDWLNELSQLIPTLLVVVERDDDGKEPVRLELDGRNLELPEQLGPIEALPGKHLLRFTLATYAPIEREVVLEKGDKNHVVRVRFIRESKPAPPPPAVQKPPPPPPRPTRPTPVATYLLGTGALAAFTASGVLLGTTLNTLSNERDTCSPLCKTSDREEIETSLLMVDALAGAGVVLGGLAIYTFVTRPIVYEKVGVVPGLELDRDRVRLKLEGRF